MNADRRLDPMAYVRQSPERDRVEVTFAGSGRSIAAHPALILEGLASEEPAARARARRILAERESPGDCAAKVRPWSDDLWLLPSVYLHGSRAVHFQDGGVDYRQRRRDVVTSFLQQSSAPPADALIVGDPAAAVERQELPDRGLAELMLSRRTPEVLGGPVAWTALSGMLWTAFAYPRRHRHPESADDPQAYFESFGSAFDVMVAVADVPGLRPGWYWYRLTDSVLVPAQLAAAKEVRSRLDDLSSHQGTPLGCGAAIILVARLDRYRWRYRHDRALRHVYVDAGRIGQYLGLLASGFDLETWFCSPLDASVISSILARDGLDDDPLYAVFLGSRPGSDQHEQNTRRRPGW